jgi:hypothetical protein
MPLQLIQDLELDAVERHEALVPGWPVAWSAVIVGALAGVAATVLFGVIALAVGAHQLVPAAWSVEPSAIGWAGVIGVGLGAFLSFLIAGWIAARMSASPRAAATGAGAALLLGLLGSVIGGWLAAPRSRA